MKKVLIIGDIHGRTDWEKMVMHALPKFYHIIFLGDYVDSFDIKPVHIMHNLKKIIGYKKKYPERITCLLGNHDFAYIGNHYQTSGYNMHASFDYQTVFNENAELFDVAWGFRNDMTKKYTLATHAGLTLTYYNNYVKALIEDPTSRLNKLSNGKSDKLEMHEILNFMKNEDILWKVGSVRGGQGTPGPLWADQTELLEDPYPEINQIFGHTATGTVDLNMKDDYFLIKVDGSITKSTANILLNL